MSCGQDSASKKLQTDSNDLEKLKKLVAKSLSDVIRFSTNGEMRKSCYDSLQTTTSLRIEEQLQKLLNNVNQKQLADDSTIPNISNKKPKIEESKAWVQDIVKDLDEWD